MPPEQCKCGYVATYKLETGNGYKTYRCQDCFDRTDKSLFRKFYKWDEFLNDYVEKNREGL